MADADDGARVDGCGESSAAAAAAVADAWRSFLYSQPHGTV